MTCEAQDDIIVIENGELFEGTRAQFRDCFFDNADNVQIINWANKHGYSVVIKNVSLGNKSIVPDYVMNSARVRPGFLYVNRIRGTLLKWLLRWWATEQMDQWDRWKLSTKRGPVYIQIGWKPDDYHYDEIE